MGHPRPVSAPLLSATSPSPLAIFLLRALAVLAGTLEDFVGHRLGLVAQVSSLL